MTPLLKIKLIAYFCFSYSLLHLLSAVGLFIEESKIHEIADSVIKSFTWAFIGYSLLKKRLVLIYWFTIILLSLIIVRWLLGVYFIGLNIFIDSLFSLDSIILLCAFVSLIILAQKDVRTLFSSNQVK